MRMSDRTVSGIRLGVSGGGLDQRLSESLMPSTIGADLATGNGGAAESLLVRGSGAVAMISVQVVGYGIPRVARSLGLAMSARLQSGSRVFFAVTVLAIVLVVGRRLGAQKLGEVSRVAPGPSCDRGVVLEWTSAEGRPYWYRVPKKIDAKKAPRLVFMLHGTGLNHGWSFWNYPIASGRFRGDDIVVSPDALTPGNGDTFNFIQGKTDGNQILGLIKLFKSRFPVSQVYVYGHSQGAFFAYWMAGAYTEWVDGIVAHAGNVLQVKHTPLSRQKLAVGILHGEADAVVPVSCAHRSAKIYRDEGYKKVKLEIVEGLTKRSGHWPLPNQVAEMFEWLDSVTTSTPSQSIDGVVMELGKPEPSWLLVRESVLRARQQLKTTRRKKLSKAERKELEERLDALEELVTHAEKAHAKRIVADEKAADGDDYAAWMAHFRSMHGVFRASKGWNRSLRKIASRAAKQETKITRVLKVLEKTTSGKAFQQALALFDRSPIAANYDDLATRLREIAADSSGTAPEKSVEKLTAILAERESVDREGGRSAAEVTRAVAEAFRKSNAELFPGATAVKCCAVQRRSLFQGGF